MIRNALCTFVDRVLETRRMTASDVDELRRFVFPDGLASREDADVLIALDRAVADKDPSFADYLVAAVVDFVVWGARPTGYVETGAARWLVTSLGCGDGPTRTAVRIASQVVREAQQVDEALLVFVLRVGHVRPQDEAGSRPRSDLAA